jgi:hypothetical protein
VRHRWYRDSEIFAAFSTEVEESYKCTKGGDQRLRGRRPTLAGPFQKKVSNGMRIPLADILAERLDQICGAPGIMPESRFLDAAMRSKPVAEGGHKSWNEGRFLNRLALADPALNEVMVEELHSEVGVIANLSTPEMRAAAPPQMAAKRIKYVEIDVRQNAASSMNEAAEMCGGSNITNGTGRSISVTIEIVAKRVDVRSTDSSAQAPKRLGRGEVLFQHGVSC